MQGMQKTVDIRARFAKLLGGEEGLETRVGAAVGPTVASGRRKAYKWFAGEHGPEHLEVLVELLEACPKKLWPARWRDAAAMDVKVGRPPRAER